MNLTRIKANGIHYTPPELASFLATAISQLVDRKWQGPLQVLDPACGDGALLCAIAEALPERLRSQLQLTGFETDIDAIEAAEARLSELGVNSVQLNHGDFLMSMVPDAYGQGAQGSLFQEETPRSFDIVISNPPYVRTQVLGAKKAQELAARFGITGRVDLYHAFTMAMTSVLRDGGVLGLLTSNRFLTIRSGASIRSFLRKQLNLTTIYDLGDTKFFEAAVLPVILIGQRQKLSKDRQSNCAFHRVYEHRASARQEAASAAKYESVLDAIRDVSYSGLAQTWNGIYAIDRGILSTGDHDDVWTLATPSSDEWMSVVQAHTVHTFDDVGQVRVGVKTTADEVFIRSDWSDYSVESELLRPLLTHKDADRWLSATPHGSRTVLYPHYQNGKRKSPIALKDYPKAASYLQQHEERLRRRTYVIEAGRQWYEIWVPHNPRDWAEPKVVFPDISEHPKFFLDDSGALVSGECYWIVLRPGFDPEWLLLLLAVANSTFATTFYDIAFHNKLYAGRRRFQTQFVKRFPLPDVKSKTAQQIVSRVREAISSKAVSAAFEREIDALVWKAFGLTDQSKK